MSEIVYLWIDLETTGLSPDDDQILETAWGFTDQRLGDLPDGALHHRYVERPNFVYPIRNAEVLRMHTENGLILDWANPASTHHAPRDVEADILEQIRELGDVTVQLAGSGVHFDREWIQVWMPELFRRLHYRIGVDVSQQERFLRDVCGLRTPVRPPSAHRASSDVVDSLIYARELRDLVVGRVDETLEVTE